MVADYNPQIVGPMNFKDTEGDFDVENEKAKKEDEETPLDKKIDRLENRIENLEDVLELKPGHPEATEVTKQELDLTPLEDKIDEPEEDKEIEEEE